MCMYVSTSLFIYRSTDLRVHICVCMCRHLCLIRDRWICVCIYVYVCVDISVYFCIFADLQICMCIYVYVYIDILYICIYVTAYDFCNSVLLSLWLKTPTYSDRHRQRGGGAGTLKTSGVGINSWTSTNKHQNLSNKATHRPADSYATKAAEQKQQKLREKERAQVSDRPQSMHHHTHAHAITHTHTHTRTHTRTTDGALSQRGDFPRAILVMIRGRRSGYREAPPSLHQYWRVVQKIASIERNWCLLHYYNFRVVRQTIVMHRRGFTGLSVRWVPGLVEFIFTPKSYVSSLGF